MSNPSSLVKAKTALIRYPRFNELHERISMCQELSSAAGEAQCLALEGATGVGKSTLARTYTDIFPRYETASGSKIPVFYVETPSPVTVKGMAARMLEELGDPGAHKGPLWSMNSRLIEYIGTLCEVELVILDDFHHLIDKKTNKILEEVSDWLKVLIKETSVPFLVVGSEGKVEQILETNRQLSRLFATPEKLEPFEWHPSEPGKNKPFAAFITYAEEGLGLQLSDEWPRPELLERLHQATGGIVGNVMNLMRYAALLAQMEGVERLTLSTLAQAFARRLQKHMGLKDNPFTLSQGQTPRPLPATDPPHSVSQRSIQRKEREPTAAEVLKTR